MSVIRYPGGKTRAIPYLEPFLPTDEIYSPFFGGGSVELFMSSKHGTRVHANDVFQPLITFWECLKDPRKRKLMLSFAKDRLPITVGTFKELQRGIDGPSLQDWERSAVFFLVNRCSFNGGATSAGFSHFTADRLQRMLPKLAEARLENVRFQCRDFKAFMDDVPHDKFLFLDPPYDIKADHLYGHKGSAHRRFDHAALAKALKGRSRWVLCYNDSQRIRALYEGCKIIPVTWYHSMRRGANGNHEVMIMPRDYGP